MATIIEHPAMARRARKEAHHRHPRNELDREMRIPTSLLKTHIGVLDAALNIPKGHELAVRSRNIRKNMLQRLSAYRAELGRRDALRDQALTGTRLVRRAEQLAKKFAA